MDPLTLKPRVCFLRQFVDANPGRFTLKQLRWWIFRGADNGLDESGAVFKNRANGRYQIDVDRFETWLCSTRLPGRRYFFTQPPAPTGRQNNQPAVAAAGRK